MQTETMPLQVSSFTENPRDKRPLRAMVLDDEPCIRLYLSRLLMRRGYEVMSFENPSQSDFCRHTGSPCSGGDNCPDVIITDINMPVMNGIDFVTSVFKRGCRCRHVALVSGAGMSGTDARMMSSLGTRYFSKPVNSSELQDWLSRVESDLLARAS